MCPFLNKGYPSFLVNFFIFFPLLSFLTCRGWSGVDFELEAWNLLGQPADRCPSFLVLRSLGIKMRLSCFVAGMLAPLVFQFHLQPLEKKSENTSNLSQK